MAGVRRSSLVISLSTSGCHTTVIIGRNFQTVCSVCCQSGVWGFVGGEVALVGSRQWALYVAKTKRERQVATPSRRGGKKNCPQTHPQLTALQIPLGAY